MPLARGSAREGGGAGRVPGQAPPRASAPAGAALGMDAPLSSQSDAEDRGAGQAMTAPARAAVGARARQAGTAPRARQAVTGPLEAAPAGTTAGEASAAPPAATSAGAAVGRATIASPEAAEPWPEALRAAVAARGERREQARPLVMETAFTGLGSQARMWRATGLRFRELATADPKPAAKTFLAANGLMGEHHFDDVRALYAGGPAACARCGRGCRAPEERPDFFAGGFPCQPTSPMRRSQKRARAEEHPSWDAVRAVADYLLARRPRVALLEQTMGALSEDSFGGVAMNECQWLEQAVGGAYAVAVAVLSLEPWVRARRARVWLFLVSRDLPAAGADRPGEVWAAEALAARAARLGEALEASRRERPPRSFRSFVIPRGDPRWPAVSVALLRGPLRTAASAEASPAWRTIAERRRAQMREAGCPWADAHPMERAELLGVSPTERSREVLEVALLSAAARSGFDPGRPEDLAALTASFWCDVSQNDMRGGGATPTFCTSTRLYDYAEDRLVTPSEMLRALGWADGGDEPSLRGLSWAQCQDLVGESQALPPLAVASWALVLAAGDALPGLWVAPAAPAEPGRNVDRPEGAAAASGARGRR